ncbi:hypothetical protein [Flavivirga algicola]|uniref:Uncharacterized protein n=1 Tax=Flavivirga algicola TaxID=2729136 RepID=A0ABX1RU86_9FLAO|nr:hypothetical protein [Flavivirga algicola]NMH87102.1 hypothetical protein [Flavivirga algicola]
MRNIKLLIGFLVIPLTGMSQGSNELILKIRAEFQRINSVKHLEKIELFNADFMDYRTDGGGKLTGFFENDQLVKITEWIGPSYGTIITDYYLKDGELFFAYQQENKFKNIIDESGEWIGLDTSELDIIFEGRYYFNDRILIKKLIKGKRMFDKFFDQAKFLEHTNLIVQTLLKSKLTRKK